MAKRNFLLVKCVILYFAAFLSSVMLIHDLDSVLASPAKDTLKTKTDWTEAEAKWKAFVEKHLENMRELDTEKNNRSYAQKTFDRQFVEICSPLISEYLSQYRVFTDTFATFLLHGSGKIVPLGRGAWVDTGEYPPLYQNRTYSSFLSKEKIPVLDSSVAVDMVQLSNDIYNAPAIIRSLMKNTEGYRIFDRHLYQYLLGNDSHWSYKAEKKGNLWTVTMEYVGPPEVSIMEPRIWEIGTDDQGYAIEVRQRRYF